MNRHPRAAMTLVEVLVSIAVSSILLIAAYAVYSAATAGWDTSRRRTDIHQRARVSLDLIARCLRAAHVTDDEQTFVFEGENVEMSPGEEADSTSDVLPAQDLLAFRTNAPLYLPGNEEAPDQTRIQFFLEAPDPAAEDAAEQPLSLKMKVDANFEEDTTESGWFIEIAEGIDQLNCRYYNGSEWDDSWTSSDGAPRAVEVTLVVRDVENQQASQTFTRICPIISWREIELQNQQQQQGTGGNQEVNTTVRPLSTPSGE